MVSNEIDVGDRESAQNGILGTMEGQIYMMNHLEEEHYKFAEAWICLEAAEPQRVNITADRKGNVEQIEVIKAIFSEEVKAQAVILLDCKVTTEQIGD